MVDKDEPIVMGTGNEEMSKESEEEKTRTENILGDIVNTIKEKQEELGKSLSDYTTSFQKPLADVMETENSIIVITDLPGVKKEDIDIDISEETIDITAKFEDEINEEGANYIKKERSYGETRRSINLPAKINIKEATAKFNDSVLTVNLPKLMEEKHKVDIK
ncbi:MAG: Hsp20/alpha crystallin family protein [Methanobacterium sp.]